MGVVAAIGGGGLLGMIAGSQDQVTSQQKNVAAPSEEERGLQHNAINDYLKSLTMQDQQDSAISNGQGIQDNARASLSGILDGSSFGLSPQEQQQISSIRDANIAAGQGDIQNFVNNNLSTVNNQAAQRGVRGQALSQLQTGALNEGTRQYGNLVAQANAQAAQQSLATPFQRVGIQAQSANANSNFMEQLRQQAISNRNNLSNPGLLNYFQNGRLGAAGTTSTQEANIGTMIGGALGGAGSVAGAIGGLKGKI